MGRLDETAASYRYALALNPDYVETHYDLGNVVHVNTYRIAGLIPGSLSLFLADILPWDLVFIVTALFKVQGGAVE
jgi:hypothetical protein